MCYANTVPSWLPFLPSSFRNSPRGVGQPVKRWLLRHSLNQKGHRLNSRVGGSMLANNKRKKKKHNIDEQYTYQIYMSSKSINM